MKGKHSKYPSRLGPRATGALAGLVFLGVAATTAHAGVLSSDSGSADSVAAAEAVPPAKSKKKTSGRTAPGHSGNNARSEVISRARTWNPHTDERVSYSQISSHNGYRTDCSGYVAMALGLPKPGPNTVGLTSSRYTERIDMSELKKGDLVMDALGSNTTRHVVIFEKWANSRHTAYWAYEQRGRYGTDYRTRDYGLSSGSEYEAYRPTVL
ncbi:hypothetical protein [Actinomadura rubrisoli]|uniref:NlpC/P60 family protein n=1 Tax=Actinomadura rubrisoli TaxID=2530368 RepID=A0A4R5B3L9_9ACTN|nr:hypothetical protein [Actinomadura rubrisoli]TDD80351.1 hypothetical protein E1298_25930 [Actinomadura rubrisoli]